MKAKLSSADVAELLAKFASESEWVSRTICGLMYGEYEVSIFAAVTDYLMGLRVEHADVETNRFVISHNNVNIVNNVLNTEEGVRAKFEEYILPWMIREYYSDVAEMLIKKVSDAIKESGEHIPVTTSITVIHGKEIERTLTSGNFSVKFVYERKGRVSAFDYQLLDTRTTYGPVSLSKDIVNIERELLSKVQQYIDSLQSSEDTANDLKGCEVKGLLFTFQTNDGEKSTLDIGSLRERLENSSEQSKKGS